MCFLASLHVTLIKFNKEKTDEFDAAVFLLSDIQKSIDDEGNAGDGAVSVLETGLLFVRAPVSRLPFPCSVSYSLLCDIHVLCTQNLSKLQVI